MLKIKSDDKNQSFREIIAQFEEMPAGMRADNIERTLDYVSRTLGNLIQKGISIEGDVLDAIKFDLQSITEMVRKIENVETLEPSLIGGV